MSLAGCISELSYDMHFASRRLKIDKSRHKNGIFMITNKIRAQFRT